MYRHKCECSRSGSLSQQAAAMVVARHACRSHHASCFTPSLSCHTSTPSACRTREDARARHRSPLLAQQSRMNAALPRSSVDDTDGRVLPITCHYSAPYMPSTQVPFRRHGVFAQRNVVPYPRSSHHPAHAMSLFISLRQNSYSMLPAWFVRPSIIPVPATFIAQTPRIQQPGNVKALIYGRQQQVNEGSSLLLHSRPALAISTTMQQKFVQYSLLYLPVRGGMRGRRFVRGRTEQRATARPAHHHAAVCSAPRATFNVCLFTIGCRPSNNGARSRHLPVHGMPVNSAATVTPTAHLRFHSPAQQTALNITLINE